MWYSWISFEIEVSTFRIPPHRRPKSRRRYRETRGSPEDQRKSPIKTKSMGKEMFKLVEDSNVEKEKWDGSIDMVSYKNAISRKQKERLYHGIKSVQEKTTSPAIGRRGDIAQNQNNVAIQEANQEVLKSITTEKPVSNISNSQIFARLLDKTSTSPRLFDERPDNSLLSNPTLAFESQETSNSLEPGSEQKDEDLVASELKALLALLDKLNRKSKAQDKTKSDNPTGAKRQKRESKSNEKNKMVIGEMHQQPWVRRPRPLLTGSSSGNKSMAEEERDDETSRSASRRQRPSKYQVMKQEEQERRAPLRVLEMSIMYVSHDESDSKRSIKPPPPICQVIPPYPFGKNNAPESASSDHGKGKSAMQYEYRGGSEAIRAAAERVRLEMERDRQKKTSGTLQQDPMEGEASELFERTLSQEEEKRKQELLRDWQRKDERSIIAYQNPIEDSDWRSLLPVSRNIKSDIQDPLVTEARKDKQNKDERNRTARENPSGNIGWKPRIGLPRNITSDIKSSWAFGARKEKQKKDDNDLLESNWGMRPTLEGITLDSNRRVPATDRKSSDGSDRRVVSGISPSSGKQYGRFKKGSITEADTIGRPGSRGGGSFTSFADGEGKPDTLKASQVLDDFGKAETAEKKDVDV